MKSTVNSLIWVSAVFFASSLALSADNICPCANPPGGQIRCPNNTIAICRIVNGKINAECIPITPYETWELQMAWVLGKVLNKHVGLNEVKNNKEYQNILQEQRYTNKETGETVTFRLPEDLKRKRQ